MSSFLKAIIIGLIAVVCVSGRPQNFQFQQPGQIYNLPFYGGAKGQVLQITKDQNGAIISQVVVPAYANIIQQENEKFTPPQNNFAESNQLFSNHLYNIQSSAQRLVELQQKTKNNSQLKADDRKSYASHLALLGESASNLAKIGTQGNQDLLELFDINRGTKKTGNKQNDKRKENIRDDGDEDVGEEEGGNESDHQETQTGDDDSVQVNAPADNASVAEAKPVGVAIAGEGGVASSKPVATAVVGPGGLAIARPVATAIAGVDHNSVGFGNKIPITSARAALLQLPTSQQLQYLANPQLVQLDPYLARLTQIQYA